MKLNLEEFIFKFKRSVKENKLYVGVWCIALLSIVVVNISTSTTYKFVGVTDSKEVNINSKHAVVIKSIHVISGEAVKKGQLLIELEREDLSLQMNEVSHRLEELNAQFKLNKELNANIKSIKKYKSRAASKNKVVQGDEEDLISIQIRSLEKELKLLHKEKEELYIFSSFDGHIGSVNYKIGESVSPFDPMITMHKKNPTIVRGYIHENLSHQIEVNKKVAITSLSSKSAIIALVKSVGTRIIEFPERFRRSATEKVWGREVMIQIPENNPFLLGEKVFMELTSAGQINIMNRTLADDEAIPVGEFEYNITPIIKGELSDRMLEPSGLVYIAELNKYLLVSDDTEHDEPLIYMLNHDGTLDPHILKVENLKEIKDMEAITTDEKGNLYIASSQSPSKKHKVSSGRKIFVKLKREGIKITKTDEVKLFDLLVNAAKAHPYASWAKLLKPVSANSKYNIELDVEGIVVKAGDLYLGLRNPVGSRREVAILKIKDIDKMFANKVINVDQVSLHRLIQLPVSRKSDRNEGISDMHMSGDNLILVTANNKKKNLGRVLRTKLDPEAEVYELMHFSNHRPEGITYDEQNKEYVVVFDNNKGDSQNFMSKFTLRQN